MQTHTLALLHLCACIVLLLAALTPTYPCAQTPVRLRAAAAPLSSSARPTSAGVLSAMMQAASVPRAAMQTHVDLTPIHYETIMARGFPFVPVKRVNVNQISQNQLRAEVETTCVAEGTPFVLEDWHNSPAWNHTLFTFPHIDEIYGDEGKAHNSSIRTKNAFLENNERLFCFVSAHH